MVKVQGQNSCTENLPLQPSFKISSFLTEFGNPTKVLLARNMPINRIQDGRGLFSLGAFSSISCMLTCICQELYISDGITGTPW